jgi:hypothetical protein
VTVASTGLQMCLVCGSGFVNPVESRDAGGGAKCLLLRCGECGSRRQAIAPLRRDLIDAGDFR